LSLLTALTALTLGALALAGCATDDDDAGDGGTPDNGACVTVAGTWQLRGTCGEDVCTITQSGCSLSAVTCVSGARSTSGVVTGSNFSYDGYGAGGGPLSTCSGSSTGSTLSGSCRPAAGGASCGFSGTRP
jgi:hypothetical protein